MLPGDVSVNTFHFDAPDKDTETNLGIANRVIAFYNSEPFTSSNIVAYFLSTVITRAFKGCGIELIDMTDPTPRVPYFSDGFTLGEPSGSASLPNEVALCASWQAERLSGVNQARRRGRIFLGPLTTGAAASASGDPARPVAGIINLAALSSKKLVVDSLADGAPLVVYSRVSNSTAEVHSGWVDNDFDTQRRRQPLATDRQLWTLDV